MDDAAPVFAVDPITDGVLVVAPATVASTLEIVKGTGELRPPQVTPSDRQRLLGIDSVAVSQHVDPHARTFSNVAIGFVGAFAAIDPVLSGLRAHRFETGFVDGVLYAESVSLTLGAASLVKFAVRRPRPQAYIDAAAHANDPNYVNRDSDSGVSFFSGHASLTATIGATATYLAFARDPRGARPWVTLGVATALTGFVSVERVRGAAHFPTDVIAGAVAGASIGVLVPHLHRRTSAGETDLWIGFAPEHEGGTVELGGRF